MQQNYYIYMYDNDDYCAIKIYLGEVSELESSVHMTPHWIEVILDQPEIAYNICIYMYMYVYLYNTETTIIIQLVFLFDISSIGNTYMCTLTTCINNTVSNCKYRYV